MSERRDWGERGRGRERRRERDRGREREGDGEREREIGENRKSIRLACREEDG